MTREEAIQLIDEIASSYYPCDKKDALEVAIGALEPKPYEKFESAKDHIYKLAGDYKCWDNRLTEDEAVELCHILEQQPCYNPDEWCHDCSEYDQDKHCCPRYNKVIRNAVEEMKQCEDAISRQATIDTLWTERKELDSCMQKCLENNQMSLRVLIKAERNRIEEDIYIINNLPPVTPQPKTGHWIISKDKSCAKCSNCNFLLKNEDEIKLFSTFMQGYRHCPYCGEKMIDVPDINDGKISEIPTGSDLQESEKINCKTTKCENCENHNYCDFESQESEEA